MASIVLRVPVAEGSKDFIEVEVDRRDLAPAVELVADDGGRQVLAAPFTLASSLRRVVPAITEVLTGLRDTPDTPDEIAMELGLKIGGETGILFAKGTAEATFVVSIKWRKPDRPAQ